MDTCPRGERELEEHPENKNGLFKIHSPIYPGPIESAYSKDLLVLDDMSLCATSGGVIGHH